MCDPALPLLSPTAPGRQQKTTLVCKCSPSLIELSTHPERHPGALLPPSPLGFDAFALDTTIVIVVHATITIYTLLTVYELL